ncbi:MAG TPA: MiaB/RimO family radical SAM methylthiotransferase, partial [Acidobacteriota bacterium]|nr:MiaB/RimO family radical SAM methylthiotransferase [Acidobacteriota bacterium]
EEAFQKKIFCSPPGTGDNCLLPSMRHTMGKTRPLVKLQDGCDARCSYCIVPHVRGPGRSARPEDAVAEVQTLVDRGFQEIVLTGIQLGAYGRHIKGHARLVDLLRNMAAISRLGRIRLSSIEPVNFDPELVTLVAGNPVFARHFHIPVQSGSDRVLRLMKRPYNIARVEELLRHVVEILPDAGVGTDIMVGFPGETGRDFEETCRFLEQAPFSYLHAFPFSPREGTEAYSLPDRVSSREIKIRLDAVLALSRQKNLSFRRRFLGRAIPAITLSREEEMGESVVLTDNFIHVRVSGCSVPPNRLVEVRVEKVLPELTCGVITGTNE